MAGWTSILRGWRASAAACLLTTTLLSPATGSAQEGEFEVVLFKVGSARTLADKALQEVLELDGDDVKTVFKSMPAVLKTGLSKSEADELRTQILDAVGRSRIREQVVLRVRPVKEGNVGSKPIVSTKKPMPAGNTPISAPGTSSKPVASVKRGEPPSEAQAMSELEGARFKLTRSGDKVTKLEPPFLAGITDDQLWLASAFSDLKELTVWNGRHTTDTGLSYLSRLPKLEQLMFLDTCPNITDEGLKALKDCSELSLLSIESPHITDAGIENLNLEEKSKLWSISFNGSKVTDKGVAMLQELPRLRVLGLEGCAITDEALKSMNSDTLRALYLTNTKVTQAGIALLEDFSELESLKLGGDAVTDEWLKALPAQLTDLRLKGTKVTDAGLQQLSRLKDLSSLSLKQTASITDAGIEQLKKSLPDLRVDRERD